MSDWYRYDENDGWKEVKTCEAVTGFVNDLWPVMLFDPDADGEPDPVQGAKLWVEGGYEARRNAFQAKQLRRVLVKRVIDDAKSRWSDKDWETVVNATRPPGVYVDVSQHRTQVGLVMILGFAVRRGKRKIRKFSLPSKTATTCAAELEVILLAQQLFPGATIYSDHADSAKRTGATYISRSKNTCAHAAAKYTVNLYNKSGLTGLPGYWTLLKLDRTVGDGTNR